MGVLMCNKPKCYSVSRCGSGCKEGGRGRALACGLDAKAQCMVVVGLIWQLSPRPGMDDVPPRQLTASQDTRQTF